MDTKTGISAKQNLAKLMDDFDTDAECRAALEALRWPKGVSCLRCFSLKVSRISTRKQFDCDECRYRFSVTTGTIFHDSHLALPKWFMAVLLMCEAKKGISANQMKRTIGCAHKTAWYLCHRIREAMKEHATDDQLIGTVEVDETYIGGKRPVGRGNYKKHKAMVMAAVARGGEIRLARGKSNTGDVIRGFVNTHVHPEANNVYTDELPAYKGVNFGQAQHQTVEHGAKEYARGDVHTNTVEGAFGLLKRSIVGSFHQISHKHLDRYLDEFEFKYNNRKNPYLFRDTLTRLVNGEAMPYEKLTA